MDVKGAGSGLSHFMIAPQELHHKLALELNVDADALGARDEIPRVDGCSPSMVTRLVARRHSLRRRECAYAERNPASHFLRANMVSKHSSIVELLCAQTLSMDVSRIGKGRFRPA